MDRRRLPRLDLPDAGRGPAEVAVDRDGRATFREARSMRPRSRRGPSARHRSTAAS